MVDGADALLNFAARATTMMPKLLKIHDDQQYQYDFSQQNQQHLTYNRKAHSKVSNSHNLGREVTDVVSVSVQDADLELPKNKLQSSNNNTFDSSNDDSNEDSPLYCSEVIVSEARDISSHLHERIKSKPIACKVAKSIKDLTVSSHPFQQSNHSAFSPSSFKTYSSRNSNLLTSSTKSKQFPVKAENNNTLANNNNVTAKSRKSIKPKRGQSSKFSIKANYIGRR